MIGIFIGIAAIVSLVSLGHGLEVAINEEFMEMGTDKIIVQPGSGHGFGTLSGTGGITLSDKDLEVVRRVKGVKEAGGFVYGVAGIKFGDSFKYTWVMGVPLDKSRVVIESMQNVEVVEGRKLRQNDKYKALVGWEIYNGNLFGERVGIGNKLLIGNKSFRVVGLLAPFGNPQDDSSIIIPLDIAKEMFDKEDSLDTIIAQVVKGVDMAEVANNIEEALRKERNVREGEEDFSVDTMQQLMETFSVILNVVQIVFFGITGISLVVGSIGIMNTMYTAVLERTREIGVMKAIGAKNSDILWIFLMESGLLGTVGGAIGVAIGVMLSKAVHYVTTSTMGIEYLKPYFPLELVLGALVFSFILGCVSGVLPAYRASKLKPVDALRYE